MKYKGLKSYQSKDIANVKIFADKQTDAQTNGQAQNYMPLIYRCGGKKKSFNPLSIHQPIPANIYLLIFTKIHPS